MSVADNICRPQANASDAWDALVDAAPQGNIFCRTWWLDVVCPDGYRLLTVERDGRIVAGMPLPLASAPRGTSIRMPRLTQTLGPLLLPASGNKYETRLSNEMELLRALVRQLPECDELSINCHYRLTNWLPFYWAGFNQTTRYTYVLEDLSDLNAIYQGISAKTRNIIRKAEKAGVSVEESDDLETFLELLSMTFRRQQMDLPYSLSLVRSIDQACRARDRRKMLFARDRQGQVHAAVYLIHDHKSAYYLMQGSDPALRASGAAMLAQWHAIRLAAGVSARYDFEGSMIEGVEHVFRSFGGEQKAYFHIYKRSREPSFRDVLGAAYRYARARLRLK